MQKKSPTEYIVAKEKFIDYLEQLPREREREMGITHVIFPNSFWNVM